MNLPKIFFANFVATQLMRTRLIKFTTKFGTKIPPCEPLSPEAVRWSIPRFMGQWARVRNS